MPTARFRTRPPEKQDAIVAHLRQLIVNGHLHPGDRLPPRTALEAQFAASTVTVQRAFGRLVEDGFVRVAGRSGTFVSERPPHTHRYVLAFAQRMGEPGWVRFWTVLANVAQSNGAQQPFGLSIVQGIEPWRNDPDYQGLLDDIASHRLAGIIFATDPWPLKGTPVLDTPGLPRVAFTGVPGETNVAGVSLGGNAAILFFQKALDRLVSRGRKRIALLTVPGISGERLASYQSALAARGLAYHAHWVQTASQAEPQWATNLVLLMFRGPREERPDALIMADDNLVEHACAGLLQLGLSVPDDMDVVAHCNFPAPAPAILPVTRLGYDIRRVFDQCIALLDRQRRGEAVPSVTVIAPLFEWETVGKPDTGIR